MKKQKHIFAKETGNPKCLVCGKRRNIIMREAEKKRIYEREYRNIYAKGFSYYG